MEQEKPKREIKEEEEEDCDEEEEVRDTFGVYAAQIL